MTEDARPLAGKTALITGGSSGIGAATALALAEAGADVAIAARRADRLEALARQLAGYDVRPVTINLDVTDEQACRAAVGATLSQLGRIDILVNAAGLMLLGPIVGADTQDWRRTMSTNVLGLMYMTHAVLPHLTEQRSGDIVNISSVAGRVARRGAGVYNASKWAVNAFSESLRQEVTEQGVRISLVEPGAVDTELTDHITNVEARQAAQDNYASMRALQAPDVARAIHYVLTQPAQVGINEILIRPTDQVQP